MHSANPCTELGTERLTACRWRCHILLRVLSKVLHRVERTKHKACRDYSTRQQQQQHARRNRCETNV
jgi:hypothetical protein